ncbi:glucan endo-1,3-beta-D-glucosidase-like [Olea europaea subsp. europaea]|uniref:Glucan endo-1,3-beta-D-glucosidase-like n=1 Tax=Olea europaea subsp. europaea TaxID=158383 RepID=A0A8S0TAX2_OLEEU|nr:glucan endo-1,3-beta-D-glucosidase-like [Olea europaea subsp. europaea]
MPGKSVDTYIYELYDEDEPMGPSSIADQSFGLFNSDGSPLYDAGLFKSSQNPIPLSPSALAHPEPAPRSAGLWCVPKPAGVSDAQLEEVINFFL